MPQADVSLPNATTAPAAPDAAEAAAAVAAGVNTETTAKTEHELEVERLRKENAKLVRRIDRRTHAVGELSRELAILRSQGGQQPARNTPAPQDDDDDEDAPAPRRAQTADPGDPEERARELAADMRRGEKIAERTRSMLDKGDKLDAKFRDTVLDLAKDIPFVDQRTGRATEFIEQVLECDDPAAVLLHIARNDDVAESLQGLTGGALGRRLARIETQVAAAKTDKPSNAPRPLEPLRPGAGAVNEPRDSDSPEEWRRKEVARLNAKRAQTQQHAAASR